MNPDLLTGSDKFTARFQNSPSSLIDLRTPKPLISPDLIASIEQQLRDAVVIFEREKHRLNAEIQRLTATLKNAESQFAGEKAELVAKNVSEQREYERKIAELQVKVRDLESRGSEDLLSKVRALETENKELTMKNGGLVEGNKQLTAQVERQRLQLAACAEEQLELLTSHRKLQQSLHDHIQTETSLRTQLSAVQNEKDRLYHSLTSERDRLSAKLAKFESELKPKPSKDFNLAEFEGKMRDNSRRIQSLEELIQETSQRYSELKSSFIEEKREKMHSQSTRSLTPQRRKVSPKRKASHNKKLSWKAH